MRKYSGEVSNPLMYGGSSDWKRRISAEFPRKCLGDTQNSVGCGTVYPPDDPNAPEFHGKLCQPCLRRKDSEKSQEN